MNHASYFGGSPVQTAHRQQNTISREARMSGIGMFGGADVNLRFLPAGPDFGIQFERTDLAGSPRIPALIEYAIEQPRRTVLTAGGATVEVTEHVLAALAGLQIDNCLVQLDAPEPPAGDGSALPFAEALLEAGRTELDAPRQCLVVDQPFDLASAEGTQELAVRPLRKTSPAISYHLDYGKGSPVPSGNLTVEITPETFLREIAFARTFVCESEVTALQSRGYGLRMTPQNVLVFGQNGVIDNELRCEDECTRHKLLDCIGDFALAGCDLQGHFSAWRTGHAMNREVIRMIRLKYGTGGGTAGRHVA